LLLACKIAVFNETEIHIVIKKGESYDIFSCNTSYFLKT
jgi:hypothetical protein